MSSPGNDPKISAYLHDEMSPAEKAAFEAGLQKDQLLRLQVLKRQAVVDRVSRDVKVDPMSFLPPEAKAVLSTKVSRPWFRRSTVRYLVILTVVIVGLAVAGIVFQDRLPPQVTEVFKGVTEKLEKLMQAGLAN